MQKKSISVWMVTYNHEDFIQEAIESVMMQKTNFSVHLYIGEDFSSDDTRVICQILKKKYPDKITLFLNEKNLGPYKNAKNIYKTSFNSGATYIAMLEGDDYWADPLKLQKQVDFLEANQDYVVCSHNAKIINEKGDVLQDKKLPKLNSDRDYSQLDLKNGAFLLTLSLVFRNVIQEFPKSFCKVVNGDTFLISLLGGYGKGRYIENIEPAMYRAHNKSIWSKLDKNKKWLNNFKTYHILKKYYQKKGEHTVVEALDVKLKRINRKLYIGLDTETKVKDYLTIIYYYINYNEILKSYPKTKKIIIRLLKYLFIKFTKNH